MFRHSALILMLWSVLNDAITTSKMNTNGKKIVIDNDAGGDDAIAIFLATLFDTHCDGPALIGLTTANGNTHENNVYYNNQKILKIAKRQDVPIYRGAKESILVTPSTNNYYGTDGLGDVNETFTDLVPAREQNAILVLIELAKEHKEDLTIVTIGTLTNIALAIKLDPDFLSRIGHLYIGAGHIHDEETPEPEFNAHMDVEAYKIVMQKASPDKVTVIPFSQVMTSLNIEKDWRLNVLGKLDSEVIKAINRYEKVALDKNKSWRSLDPATVAVALRPDLVHEFKYSQNDIITSGDKRGINTNRFVDKDSANVRIVHSIKIEEYKKFLLDVFSSTA